MGGWGLGQQRFLKLFLASSYERCSLHDFVCLFVCLFVSFFFFFFFFYGSGRSHVPQTEWVYELRFMELFLATTWNRSSLHKFFCFYGSGRSRVAQTQWVREPKFMK